VKVGVADGDAVLAAHVGEASAEVSEELGDAFDERRFEVSFVGVAVEGDKVGPIGVGGKSAKRAFTVEFGHGDGEVCWGVAFAEVELGGDAVVEHGVCPAVADRSSCVPLAVGAVVEAVEEDLVLAPSEILQKPLQNLRVGPGGGEGSHVPKVARREPSLSGVSGFEIGREPVDGGGSVALFDLAD
jgi:hypothetical protein